jgi:hypothetical protein
MNFNQLADETFTRA